MYSYIAYGLRIGSEIAFPNLVAGRGDKFDVLVRFGEIGSRPNETETLSADKCFRTNNTEICRVFDDTGTIVIRDGREIIVEPVADAEVRAIRSTILGPVFGALLDQRGQFVLHASAVAIEGTALAFVGAAGRGKSTLALACYAQGHCFIADDVTPLNIKESTTEAIPSYPQINVSPEALDALSYDPMTFEKVEPGYEKRAFPVTNRFSDQPLRLGYIFVLLEGHKNVSESLRPREALSELLANSNYYLTLTKQGAVEHLRQCGMLVNHITIHRVKIHPSLQELPDVVQLIEDELEK